MSDNSKTASLSRRQFIQTVAAASSSIAIAGCLGDDDNDNDNGAPEAARARFTHDVASGDPLQDRVILWTRALPEEPASVGDEGVEVTWEVAADESFETLVNSGTARAQAANDYTVKVDAAGLLPGSSYYYRFRVGDTVSSVGRTKTLPAGDVAQVKLGVFSCTNYPAGFFHVYREAALRGDLDAVLHLGDYIYEYGSDGYATEDAEALGRLPEPPTETITLADYRTRIAQYRSDPDLQLLHRTVPMIAVWDDHEVTNDTYESGAENHQPETEGSFIARRDDALKAYSEWLPIRPAVENGPEALYRRFDFGNLLTLHMLETRLTARDQQLDLLNYFTGEGFDIERFNADSRDPNRELIGPEQLNWLRNQMADSQGTWQVLGQQVLMARMELPSPLLINVFTGFGPSLEEYIAILQRAQTDPESLTAEEQGILSQPNIPYNIDAWDGYYREREAILAAAQELDKNLVVLAGDTHNAWASNLTTEAGAAVGVEMATASVSSPGFEESLGEQATPEQIAGLFLQFVETLQYTETAHRGYLVVTFTPEAATGEWIFVDTVKAADYQVLSELNKTLQVRPGSEGRVLVEV